MKKKKKLIISILALLFLFLLITPTYIYIKNVIIYEPFTLEFTGKSSSDIKEIEIISTSPFGNKEPLHFERSLNCWWSYFKHYKAINIIVPDTLLQKTDSVIVIVKDKRRVEALKNLQIISKSGGKCTFILPLRIFGGRSFMRIIISILNWDISKTSGEIILLLIGISLLIYLGIKFKKGKLSLRSLPPLLIISGVSVIIACALFFGYLLFKYTIATYFTSVLFIMLAATVIWYIAKIIIKVFRISKAYSKRIKKTIKIFIICWSIIETFFWFTGIFNSYNERMGFYYKSGFVDDMPKDIQNPHLHVHPKNMCIIVERKEFSYPLKYNSEGLRDRDHSFKKDTNEYRIMCFGNSFTEGIGTPQDSTWPRLLEDKLKNISKKKISVFNTGVTSSDPFFEYMLLKERMIKYKPDLVLYSLSSTDQEFYFFRGGFERFTPDGFHYRKAPSWEKLYAASQTFRYIMIKLMHYRYFLPMDECDVIQNKVIDDTYKCMQSFYKLSVDSNFKFAVIFNDERKDSYVSLLKRMKNEKVIPVINLYDYNFNIEKLTDDKYWNYKWTIDGHYKSKGYDMYARGVEWNLMKMGIVDSLNSE